MSDRRVVAAVLAAGAGTRFTAETPKLLAPLHGRPLVQWAVESALAAAIGEVVVVGGAVDVRRAVPPAARVVANHRWAEGQATSLAVAVEIASAAGADSLVVALGDQPGIAPHAWRAVAAVDAAIVVATYGGERAHPVAFRRDVWASLPTTGDAGARALLGERPDLVVEVACAGDPTDVDTVEDLGRWS